MIPALQRHLQRGGRLGLRALRSNAQRLPRPYKLTFAVTYGCSHRCKACHIWTRDTEGELSTAELQRFFRRNDRFSWIDLTGGEVSEREDILEVVDALLAAQQQLYLFHFPTSGWEPERVEALARQVLRRKPPRFVVSCSVDGPPALNDRLRGRDGAFARSTETARRLRALPGVEVAIGVTLSERNLPELEKLLAEVHRAVPGIDDRDIHFNVAHESAHYYKNVGYGRRPGDAVLRALQDHARRHGTPRTLRQLIERTYQRGVPRYMEDGRSAVVCRSLSASVFIDPHGTVYPCTIWDHPVGQLREHDMDLAPIWRGESAQAAQREVEAFRCPGCWTPCEAYQSLLGDLRGSAALLTSRGADVG